MRFSQTRLLLVPALMTCLALAGPVMAGGADDSGFFIAGGSSRASLNDSDFDDSDTAATFRLGYMFNGFVGIEGGYHDLGGFTDDIEALEDFFAGLSGLGIDVGLDLDGYSAGVVLNLPIKLFDLYGKAGAFSIDAEVSVDTPLGRFAESDTSTEPFFAIGAEVDFGKFNVFGELTRIDLGQPGFEDLDLATLGLKLEF